MASLLNTKWQITADHQDFLTTVVTFQPGGAALVEFPRAVSAATMGTWSEGPHFTSFKLDFVFAGVHATHMTGTHQDKVGSGLALIDNSMGTQKSPFHMANITS